MHGHAGLGDGAGFVDAQNVHAGKRFNVVQQNLSPGKAHRAEYQRDGREHIQPLRDHAEDGRDGGDDALLKRLAGIEIALRE